GDLRTCVEAGAKPHDVAAALMRELSSVSPSVVVLEDIHWADEATLDVISLVGRRLGSVAALVVATYRDDEVGRTHPLRIALGELPSRVVTRVKLHGLSEGAVAALAAPAGIDPGEMYARTGGNPFFVSEVIAARTTEVPHTVREAVLARTGRL